MIVKRLTPETHPALFAALRAWGEREMRANLERRHPPPFLVTDSYQRAESILPVNYGCNIRDFRVILREDGLLGLEGDVYVLNTGARFTEQTWALWERLHQRVLDGRIRDLGSPPERAR